MVPQPFADAGVKVGHVADGDIKFDVEGWAGNTQQVGPSTFRVRFDREGVNGRTAHIVIGATNHGDEQYRETTAVAHFFIPSTNAEGQKQVIAFPSITDVRAGTAAIPLGATVDSPLPVDYYVSWGPAVIDHDTLRFTEIPARGRYPVEVVVTAYQWGKATDPKYASAQAMRRVFHLLQTGK